MLNILVTGAAGLIGGEVCARLAKAGHAVHALVHRNPEVRSNDGALVPVASTHRGNIQLAGLGLEAGALGAIDFVIHCAASIRFDLSDADYAAINVEGTRNALVLAERLRARFLHVSTAFVCGHNAGVISEAAVAAGTRFANGYEASKADGEAVVRGGAVPFAIVRPSIVLGEAETGRIRGFDTIYGAFKLIAEGRISKVPASHDATLDFVPIDHVAASIVAVAERMDAAAGGTFHLVSGGALPMAEFADAIGAYPQFERPHLIEPDAFDPASLPPIERRLHARVSAVYASYFQRSPVFDDAHAFALIGLCAPPADRAYMARQIDYAIAAGFLRSEIPQRQRTSGPARQRTSG